MIVPSCAECNNRRGAQARHRAGVDQGAGGAVLFSDRAGAAARGSTKQEIFGSKRRRTPT